MTDSPSQSVRPDRQTRRPDATPGPIAWMARNSVAANMLMLVILAAGVVGVFRSKQEVFPEFSMDIISVQVPYPGASPEEVEQGIVLAVEEAVRGIDGVKRVSSTAGEGIGQVTIELQLGEDPNQAVQDVKNQVDRITTFPQDAEKPIVQVLASTARVISIVISGDMDMHHLHELAEMTRSDMLDEGITQVAIEGVPRLEVAIEIPQRTLEAYGLSLEQVAAAIRTASVEMPGGAVKTDAGEILIRVTDRKRKKSEFEAIVIRNSPTGSQIRLGDIATVRDGFEETDSAAFFNGDRAVRVTAYRVGSETPKDISNKAKACFDNLRHTLPDIVNLTLWEDDSELLTARIDLLNKNALYGGILVIALLALVLRVRLAFWVALGIPISFMGAFALMPSFDISINMISLFAYILTLGMVVDDAIVVGENIYHKMQHGMSPKEAAVVGAREMAMPVTFSILTTLVALSPLFFIPGIAGKLFYVIPVIVSTVLLFSLLEAFFILPAHLAHHAGDIRADATPSHFISRMRERINTGLERFVHTVYAKSLRRLLKHRYIVLASAVALAVATMGLVAGGIVPIKFFPNLEGDRVRASVELPFGTPIEETQRVRALLEAAAQRAIAEKGGDTLLRGMFTYLGSGPTHRRGPNAGAAGNQGSHLLTIELNLVPSDQRKISAREIRNAWERHMPPIPGLRSIAFKSAVGPTAGAAIDIQLASEDIQVLQEASWELSTIFKGFEQLTDVENSFSEGKQQIDYQLRPEATSVGLTSRDVARQLRHAFFGAEAIREQRGRNEIRVMVRYPESERTSEYNLETMHIRTPNDGQVPLAYVTRAIPSLSPTAIKREGGKRIANVTAELGAGVTSPAEVLKTLFDDHLPKLMLKYPGLSWNVAGEQREQEEFNRTILMNTTVALLIMFALIAVPFKSYIQPIMIMAAIPFGVVGAILGHLAMGYTLSMISGLGIVALAGVVVNDSLVLIDAINKNRRDGRLSAMDAVIEGGKRRFRPILLTSLTTFLGLTPMITETSVQARFLIPMAISLGFGVLFATLIILVLIPAFYLTVEDIRHLGHRIVQWIDQ